MELNGQTALVTGASRGLGRAVAAALAERGAAVAVNYLQCADGAESLAAGIRSRGGRAFAVQADVAEPEQVAAMLGRIQSEFGSLTILVNNAGMLFRGDLGDFDYANMDRMRRTNVDGLVHVTRAAAGGMKKAGYGRIVNLTSIAGFGTAMAGTTFYAATKAAVSLLTRRFAMELGPYGITVNAVAPGFILTDMATQGRTREEAEKLFEAVAAKAMLRRVGYPEDIGHAVAFLASPAARFITAQILTVDGGRMDYIGH